MTRKNKFAFGTGMLAGGALIIIGGLALFPQYVGPELVLVEMIFMVVGVVLMIKNIEPPTGN